MHFPDLINEISLTVPSFNLRNPLAFKINFHSTNYDSFTSSFDSVLYVYYINYVNNIDLFHNTLSDVLFNLD